MQIPPQNLGSYTYPAGQQWGTMFITVCKPVPRAQRHFSLDLSAYPTLALDMRATVVSPVSKWVSKIGNSLTMVALDYGSHTDNGEFSERVLFLLRTHEHIPFTFAETHVSANC